MDHVEPAHLVELALGNAAPSDEDADALRHIEQCDHCRDELRTMTRVVTAARSAHLVDLPTAPPERVWRRISRDLSPETAAPRPPTGRHLAGMRKPVTALALAGIVTAAAVAAAAAARWYRHDRRPTG